MRLVTALSVAASASFVGCHGTTQVDKRTSSLSSVSQAAAPTPSPTSVSIAGTVSLAADIDAQLADNLTPGAPVSGATVFLKGAPSESVQTDATGAFTLAVSLPASGSLTDSTDNYTLVTWYTTPTLKHRFGVQVQTAVDSGTPKNLGAIDLGLTRVVALAPIDQATGDAIAPAGCQATFPGYAGKITAAVDGASLQASYMPPGPYTVTVQCTGYQALTESISVGQPSSFSDMQTVSVPLTHD